MLVDVLELYFQDEKLSRCARRQATPVRCTITVDRMWSDRDLEDAPVHANVVPPRLEPLYGARMRYWKGRNVVLSGRQRGLVKGTKNTLAPQQQWWWCQIVMDPSIPPRPLCERREAGIEHPLGGDMRYGGLM